VYTYDKAGRLTQVVDATGTYTFTYDDMDRLKTATVSYAFLTARPQYMVSYTYDKAGNRKTMTDPESGVATYTYDNGNRLTGLQDFQLQNYTLGYSAVNSRLSLTRPNSVATTYTYDNIQRLTGVTHKLGTTVLDGATYTFDAAGNRKTRTDQRLNTTLTYAYDNIYQLLSAKQGTTTKETYTYDRVGNRLSSLGVTPYVNNSSNELTSIPGTSYTYDNNGNMATKTDATGVTTYTWDYENRLVGVALPGAGGSVAYKYDPFGRRVQKAFTQGSTTTPTNYVYDGRKLLEEIDQNGNVLARYGQGPSIDEPMSELRSSTTSYYDIDFLGSTTSLSNSAGALANTYTYDAFGKQTASTGTIVNPFRYTGRELDAETGLYNYRFRYYDQNVGRFLSEDPILWDGGINLYRYADGNPVSKVDPMGLDTNVCYYPSSRQPWGHLGFGLPQEGEQGTYGFYPDSWNVANGPGRVKPDDEHKAIQCKTIRAPKEKDQCMLQCRIRRQNNPGNYKALTRQCTQFVRECLRECGEPSGSGNSPYPKDLIDSLP
jgi:RHS repeat-associated protein